MNNENSISWAAEEFADIDLGDKRLNKRLIHLCERFSNAPESPINQASEDWGETKNVMKNCRAVTVCDRESDIYDFFKLSNELEVSVLVCASSNRTINRKTRYPKD